MLPGFRFLSAAILLSISILMFGIGAAALLRTTHEQFTSNPSWLNRPQEQLLTQTPEPPAQPVLAILRVAPVPVPATSPQDQVPTIGLPASEPEQATAANSDETAKKDVAEAPPVETPAGEPASPDEATSAKVDISATPTPIDAPASSSESTAATAEAPPAPTLAKPGDAKPGDTPSSGPQQADTTPAPTSAAPGPDTTATATGEKEPAAKTTPDGTPATTAAKRPARRTKKRMARRPPQPQQQVQPFYLFGEPPANTH